MCSFLLSIPLRLSTNLQPDFVSMLAECNQHHARVSSKTVAQHTAKSLKLPNPAELASS